MSTDQNAIENSIQTILTAASGLAGTNVVWADTDRDRPVGDYMALRIDEDQHIGTPENSVRDNPAPVAGEEILLASKNVAEFEVAIQAFSALKVSTGAAPSARARLNALRSKLEGEAMVEVIEAAGLALVDLGSVRNMPRVLETQYQGRATLVLKFRISDEIEEATTYIETAISSGSYT